MTGSLHVGLAALGAAIEVGLIAWAPRARSAQSRSVHEDHGQSILAIAFAEAIVFYALFLVQ